MRVPSLRPKYEAAFGPQRRAQMWIPNLGPKFDSKLGTQIWATNLDFQIMGPIRELNLDSNLGFKCGPKFWRQTVGRMPTFRRSWGLTASGWRMGLRVLLNVLSDFLVPNQIPFRREFRQGAHALFALLAKIRGV